MLAVVAMAAFSCAKEVEQKEEDIVTQPEKAFIPKVISALTDDDVAPDTKTSLSGVNILWASTDNIKGYNGTDVYTSTSTAISDGGKKADFTFATVSVEDDLLSIAYPAENVSDIDDDYVYATIPSVQTATAGSFANGANVAIADGLTPNPVFKNVGGLLSIIINNDDITSVKLSANEELTGSSMISTGTLEFAEAIIDEGVKSVTLTGSIANGTEYYAVVYPGTYTGLKIEVTNTSGQVATYSNPNSLTVGRNANLFIAELTIPGGKWVSPTKGDEYTWIAALDDFGESGTPLSSIEAGTPLLTWTPTYTWGGAGASKYLGTDGSGRGVQIGSGSATNKCSELVLETSGYTGYVKDIRINFSHANSGGASVSVKVGETSLKNGVNTSVNATTLAADYLFEADALVKGDITITFANSASKAFYIKSIVINPDARSSQSLSFPSGAYSVDLEEGSFASPELSGAKTSVTYSSDNTSVATVNPSSGLVTLVSAGLANITATAEADETYKEGSATYALTVMTPSSIASVLAASTGTDVYTSGVVSQINNRGFILTDGTNNVFVYNGDEVDVIVGQAVKVRGTRGINNGIPQITSPVITKGSTGQSVERTALTVITKSNATGHSNSTYISLSGKLSFSSPYYNVSIDGSSTQGSLYQVSGTEAFTAGTLSSLVGSSVIVTGYIVGSTSSYLSIAVVDIVIDTITPTLSTTPESGEIIEWDDDKYGVGNAETITVVLNGAASGYTVSYTDAAGDWSVTDNGSGTITVYPFAANASTTTDKTLAITITHKDNGELTSVINLKQKKIGGTTWARVTSVATLLAGGTFIIGYESTANSGIIVPMANSGSASTSAAGFMYSGATATSGGSGTINMATVETTSSYEVQMGESSEVDGAIYIKIGDNYLGNTNTKNNCKLFTSQASTTSFKPTLGSNDTFTLEIEANTGEATNYKYLKYNTGSPRFAVYSTTPEKIVIYKKN